MNNPSPLINDEYAGLPSKRALAYVQSQREKGRSVVGTYCGFAPLEMFRAAGAVPAILCAFANSTVESAENVLPSNLCPLIKSSFGYVLTDTCPFFAVSDAVVAETTCDGKKKMFELIADKKPMYVMDLPQMPDEEGARETWAAVIGRLRGFLENTFGTLISDDALRAAIRDTNAKLAMMNRIFDYAAHTPPLITWSELYELTFLAQPASGSDMQPLFEACLKTLEERKAQGMAIFDEKAPRVMVTGCPVGGDATKVFKIIDELGGAIVALDSCTGYKSFMDGIADNGGDPVQALAEHYLNLPCACMSPNARRLTMLDRMIERFRPDAVIEVVLHACHTYNVESYRVREHLKERHNLPYLKIETDYSQGDVKQIHTRIQALFETL